MLKNLLKNKLVKILFIIILIIIILWFLVFIFLKLWPPFGRTPATEDMEDYAKRATNYKNGKFYNENEFQMIYNNKLENKFVSTKSITPIEELPIETPTYPDNPSTDALNITWLGHSSILMQMHGLNVLIDPVFSEYSSPVPFAGPKRFSESPIKKEDLPNIDILVITHDHYDHLDYNTIKEIDNKVDKYIVPLGIENHLESWGVSKDKITNMAWWEEVNIDGLTIGCTPARHYSRRSLNDSYKTLWASFVFIDEYHKVFDSGDTGFDKHFKEIHNKYGDFDIALIDSGQYDVRWKSTHMIPEESVTAGKILNAKTIMPIHWGAYKLAQHPWDDSVERFTQEAEKQSINYITPKIGETFHYGKEYKNTKWWKDIN